MLPKTKKYRQYSLDQLLGLRTGLKNDDPNVLDVEAAILEKTDTVEDYLKVFFMALGNSDLENIALMILKETRENLSPQKRYFILNKINKLRETLEYAQ